MFIVNIGIVALCSHQFIYIGKGIISCTTCFKVVPWLSDIDLTDKKQMNEPPWVEIFKYKYWTFHSGVFCQNV